MLLTQAANSEEIIKFN